MSYYSVYLVAYLGAPRDHHAIFVETDAETGAGIIIHVKGDIQRGMTFESKRGNRPEDSNSFVEKTFLGLVSVNNYHHIEEICRTIPPPKKQFDGPRRLYPREPLRRCQEWTNEAIQILISNNILLNEEPAEMTEPGWVWSEEYQNWYLVNEDGTFTWAESGENSGGSGKGKKKSKGRK